MFHLLQNEERNTNSCSHWKNSKGSQTSVIINCIDKRQTVSIRISYKPCLGTYSLPSSSAFFFKSNSSKAACVSVSKATAESVPLLSFTCLDSLTSSWLSDLEPITSPSVILLSGSLVNFFLPPRDFVFLFLRAEIVSNQM